MPRAIFRNRILASAGPLPGQLTTESLKHWTKNCKGTFSEAFDETVTHLLCTTEQFNKKVPRVKEALKRGKRFHIVHHDWFEFSTVAGKKLPERDYSMRKLVAKQRAAKRDFARVERGRREGERAVNTNFYHIYHDREMFFYQINLTRDEESSGEPGQRYALHLWESNAKPHLYWFTAKFLKKKGDSQPRHHRPSLYPGKWCEQMDLFMEFFRIKTGIEWQDRVLRQHTMPASFFQYSPPTGNKPLGRRLRFSREYCLEINAETRGLPWPPIPEPAPELTVGASSRPTPPPSDVDDEASNKVKDVLGEDQHEDTEPVVSKTSTADFDAAEPPTPESLQDKSSESDDSATPAARQYCEPPLLPARQFDWDIDQNAQEQPDSGEFGFHSQFGALEIQQWALFDPMENESEMEADVVEEPDNVDDMDEI